MTEQDERVEVRTLQAIVAVEMHVAELEQLTDRLQEAIEKERKDDGT